MGQYSKTDIQLLCDQINRDNPALETPLTPDAVMLLGVPQAGANGRNTSIKLNGVSGAGFVGKRFFNYDRLNLNTLYAGAAAGLVVSFPNSVAFVADALPSINAAFGLELTAEGIVGADTLLPQGKTPTSISITVTATNLAFIGTLTFKWRRGAAGVYPQSGPGTKEMLIGDLTLGYFGSVSASELFTAGEFFSQITEGYNRGAAVPLNVSSLYFLKFAINDKFVFFPSRAMTSNITWELIYALGAIDASGQEATFPPASGGGVPQTAILQTTDKKYWLRPRLVRYSDVDPEIVVKGLPTSETELLFKKVHVGTGGTGEWDTLTVGGNGLDITSPFFFLNSLAGTTTKAHYCSMNQATLSTLDKTAQGFWRPMFELVPSAQLLVPPKSLTTELVNIPKRMTIEYTESSHATVAQDLLIVQDGFAPVIGWDVTNETHISRQADVLILEDAPEVIYVTHSSTLPEPQ